MHAMLGGVDLAVSHHILRAAGTSTTPCPRSRQHRSSPPAHCHRLPLCEPAHSPSPRPSLPPSLPPSSPPLRALLFLCAPRAPSPPAPAPASRFGRAHTRLLVPSGEVCELGGARGVVGPRVPPARCPARARASRPSCPSAAQSRAWKRSGTVHGVCVRWLCRVCEVGVGGEGVRAHGGRGAAGLCATAIHQNMRRHAPAPKIGNMHAQV